MKNFARTFLSGIYAGIFIGIAGTVFLSVKNPQLGAFLFAFGLLTIVCYQFKLFTGAVGYLAEQSRTTFLPYLLSLFAIWTGNFIGCLLTGTLIRRTRFYSGFSSRVAQMCEQKVADGACSILILAFFCGILMYIAVETFRRQELPGFVRGIMVFMCVSVFILSGFEHSIAGMYYFSVAGKWCAKSLCCVLLMSLGNALGGMLVPFGNKFRLEKKNA